MALINGTPNSDTIEGSQERDEITALPGNDGVSGFADSDSINGNQGADTLNGGRGHDSLRGGVSAAAIDPSRFRSISSSSSTVPPVTQAAPNFDIRFDYRYDTNGFFSDPKRRAVLEAAANSWESIIKDEFPDIPVGTSTPLVNNPQTDVVDEFITDTPIDDLLVFVGSRELGGSTLAQGGPSGFFTNESRYTGSNFEPWIGAVGFDASTNWFFDQTLNTADDIPGDAFDFFSVALHELEHVLGFGTAKAFDNLVSGSNFNDDRAKAANGGNPIPLAPAPDLGHIEVGYRIDGVEPLMLAASGIGVRNFVTSVDIAVLADIGYIV